MSLITLFINNHYSILIKVYLIFSYLYFIVINTNYLFQFIIKLIEIINFHNQFNLN